MRQRIIRFIALYFVTVVVFALQHPLFMLFHNEVFGGIGFSDVVDATWHGLRLDLSMAGYLTTIPGLMLVASSFTPDIRWLTKSLRCWYVVVSVAMSLVFTVDVCLYGYWGFRLDATPVFYFFTSPADAMASVSGLFIFLGLIGAIIYGGAIYLLFNRVISGKLPPIVDSKRRIISAATLTVCSGILFIPIRGGFTTATMNLSVAYYSQNQRLNHAAINPMFSFMYSALHQDNFGEQYRYMDDLEATRLMETLTDNAPINTDSIPRLFTTNRPDVFIIILESFSSHLMTSLGGEPIAVNLDRMANEGISFTNFYACSFRTDRGLTSILSGYPALPGTSIMKYAEKVEHLPSISKSTKATTLPIITVAILISPICKPTLSAPASQKLSATKISPSRSEQANGEHTTMWYLTSCLPTSKRSTLPLPVCAYCRPRAAMSRLRCRRQSLPTTSVKMPLPIPTVAWVTSLPR